MRNATGYDALRTQTQKAFGDLPSNFKFFYLDSDGERNGKISQKLGFAQISSLILNNPLTINDTSSNNDVDSITIKGVCEIDSIISILNRGNVLDNTRFLCSNGFLFKKLEFPKGTITQQQISVFQKI